VAEGVGRTPPSIYLHFDTKDDLIRAVCHRQFGALAASFEQAIAGVDDPLEQIEAMARAYVGFAVEHPEQYRILFMSGVRKGDGEPGDLDELALIECFGMLVTAVQAATEHQLIDADDPALVALALWAGTRRGLFSHLDRPRAPTTRCVPGPGPATEPARSADPRLTQATAR
jgi:AcrR family transcriptional regulator